MTPQLPVINLFKFYSSSSLLPELLVGVQVDALECLLRLSLGFAGEVPAQPCPALLLGQRVAVQGQLGGTCKMM